MIRVYYDDEEMTLDMMGHAGGERNEEGHDLVCAAASILLQTLASSGGRYGDVDYLFESGKGHVQLKPQSRAWHDAQRLLTYTMDGIELLRRRYPQCIEIVCT